MTRKSDFDRFKARGGKFIFFQGWADPVITPMMDVDFYTQVVARYGQAATDGFFRFFPLAGMGHCSGGAGFSHIGGATGAPIQDDAGHDMVRALEQWVNAERSAIAVHRRPYEREKGNHRDAPDLPLSAGSALFRSR